MILLNGKKEQLSPGKMMVCAVFIGCALLSHGGSAFAVPAFAVMFLVKYGFPGFKRSILAIVVFAAVMAPWQIILKEYQVYPNRLIKVHFAGDEVLSHESNLDRIVSRYREIGFNQAVRNRIENIKLFFVAPEFDNWFPKQMRTIQYVSVFWMLGVLNAGWFFIIFARIRKRYLDRRALQAFDDSIFWLLSALVTMATWVLLMFLPDSTTIQQGPFPMMIQFFIGLCLAICCVSERFALLIVLANMVVSALIWYPPDLPNPPTMIIPMLLMVWTLGVLVFVQYRHETTMAKSRR
jgi:hypothetical protein